MSTETQILFNAAALQSLKRDQLFKLCKIHGVKANGKNEEIIERLRQHGLALETRLLAEEDSRSSNSGGAGSSLGAGGDDGSDDRDIMMRSPRVMLARPSEAWEIVMDTIEEMEESSSMGTFSSTKSLGAGEFGSGSSKNGSMLKALASSLGLKRGPLGSASASTSNSASSTSSSKLVFPSAHSLTLPSSSDPDSSTSSHSHQTALTTPEPASPAAPAPGHDRSTDGVDPLASPLPGTSFRPGRPAPADARLSLGAGLGGPGPSTTIRLVSASSSSGSAPAWPSPPKLAPFATTFDLDIGSPFRAAGASVWPLSPGTERMYPALPTALGDIGSPTGAAHDADADEGMPGGLTVPPANDATPFRPTKRLAPTPEPFIFGSPNPRHSVSNADFSAAASSVLDEMNRRLVSSGVTPVDTGILAKAKTGTTTGASIFDGFGKPGASPDRFEKLHEQQFGRMESIADHLHKKRAMVAGLGVPGEPTSRKRKSDALGKDAGDDAKRRAANVGGVRVISNGVRRKMIPGAFGGDDDDESEDDAQDRRMSKRPRFGADGGADEGKGPVDGMDVCTDEERQKETGKAKEEERISKEREAVRRKLEASRARRRSSRVSGMGVKPRPSGVKPPLPKPSRFGFLSSAKSLVRNVWGGGSKSKAAPIPTASNIPVPKSSITSKSAAAPAPAATKPAVAVTGIKKPIAGPSAKAASSSTQGAASGSVRSSMSAGGAKGVTRTSSVAGSTSRTSTRAFGSAAGSSRTTRSAVNSVGSRLSTATGVGASLGTRSSRTSTAVSSVGTRSSLMRGSAVGVGAGDVGSTGAKRGSVGTRTSTTTAAGSATKRASTLYAPTASSLARMQAGVRPHAAAAVQDQNQGQSAPTTATSSEMKAALEPITNASATGASASGSGLGSATRTGGIFKRPLVLGSSPTKIPSPVRGGAAATAGPSASSEASTSAQPAAAPPPRAKVLPARKPRISRSRVIAKLGAQRASASASIIGSGAASGGAGAGPSAPRVRSSMAAGERRSFGGKAGRGSLGADVAASARKKARRSEIARRRSRPAVPMVSVGAEGSMEVDG